MSFDNTSTVSSITSSDTEPTIYFSGLEPKGSAAGNTVVTIYSCSSDNTATATCSAVGTSNNTNSVTVSGTVNEGTNYFALKQVDPYNNESIYSAVVTYELLTITPDDPVLAISPAIDNSTTPVTPYFRRN